MSLTAAQRNFAAYLHQPIERYPISRIPLSLKMRQDHRKELIFQQKLFLQVADEYISDKPWISYFAAIKHFRLLDAKEVSTASFNEIRDKEFSTEVAAYAESVRDRALAALDKTTIGHLENLCNLQAVSPLIPVARSTLGEISTSKHHSAVVVAATGKKPASGCAIILGASLIGGFVATVFPDSDQGLGVLLAMVIAVAGAAFAYLPFSRWQAVTHLLARYKANIVPAAELLGENPLKWLEKPDAAIGLLNQIEQRRTELEQMFFGLEEARPA